MLKTIFAKKVGMTAKYTPQGERVGATVLVVVPMTAAGIRTRAKDGYSAWQIKAQIRKTKSQITEVRTNEADLATLAVGAEVKFDEVVKPGDRVVVSGVSKGKGFAGVVKRHGFAGGPRTHGQSDRERAPGSIGQTTTPGRVYKGKRMAGRLGGRKVTLTNLAVLDVDAKQRQIWLAGGVPGPASGLLTITRI